MINTAAELRSEGWSKEQIATALVNGRPIAEADRPRASQITDHFKSKTERYYSWFLDNEKAAGHILRWEYEAIKFRLADTTEKGREEGKRGAWYTPDFDVWYPDGTLEIVEIKGYLREAARLRFLTIQQRYSGFRWRMIRRTKGGAWVDIL